MDVKLDITLPDLGHINKRDILEKAGFFAENAARKRINKTKTDPDGVPWEPVNKEYRKRKRKGDKNHPPSRGGLLVRSGAMRDALQYAVTSDSIVEVGSATEYATYHQHGTKNIPKRTFVGFSTEDSNELEDVLVEYIEREIKKRASRASQ